MSRRRDELAVVAAARAMLERGLVTGTVGNVSLRRGDEVILTPTRTPYPSMRRVDLVTVAFPSGSRVRGRRVASQELPLHLAVHRARPDLRALVHTHSPHATAWSFLGAALLPELEEATYYGIGRVTTTPPAPAGSQALATGAVAGLGSGRAVLLGRHGVLAGGGDLAHALAVAEAVERQAQVAWLLRGGTPAQACGSAALDAVRLLPA